jgi:HPt (histidine-containing phosphotransfer) domain-containing protein
MPDEMFPALKEVWSQYQALIFQRAAALQEATLAAEQGALQEELRQRAMREAHKLAGSLGMFGLHEGTRLAREVEHLLGGGSGDGQSEASRLSELTVALYREIEPYRGAGREG